LKSAYLFSAISRRPELTRIANERDEEAKRGEGEGIEFRTQEERSLEDDDDVDREWRRSSFGTYESLLLYRDIFPSAES